MGRRRFGVAGQELLGEDEDDDEEDEELLESEDELEEEEEEDDDDDEEEDLDLRCLRCFLCLRCFFFLQLPWSYFFFIQRATFLIPLQATVMLPGPSHFWLGTVKTKLPL